MVTQDFKTYEHIARQLDIIPVNILASPITIIGAGAIGSFTTLQLAKMGFQDITVFDFDKIEIENMNCQFYRLDDVGRPKAEALHDLVFSFTHTKIKAVTDKYTGGEFNGIVISAVDNMAVRRTIWDNHKLSLGTTHVIDPRMGAETALLFVARPGSSEDIESYEKTLYEDKDAVQEPCTAKATIYTANMLSGLVAKTVKDCLTGSFIKQANWDIKKHDFIAWERKI